jgi:hypothetical protein
MLAIAPGTASALIVQLLRIDLMKRKVGIIQLNGRQRFTSISTRLTDAHSFLPVTTISGNAVVG